MDEEKKKPGLSASFVTGAVALVFLIVGYQVALFVNRAAVSKIMSVRESPDTVFVVDEAIAARVLGGQQPGGKTAIAGRETSGRSPGSAEKSSGAASRKTESGKVIVNRPGSHPSTVSAPAEASGTARSAGRLRNVENFRFNPNEVTVDELVRLGFSEKQAMSIDNYRKKGGHFSRKSDFAKSFVVSDSIYARLEPYIDIPLLDLNAADSAAFDALPGIGGYFASKMVAHRERLGGYSFKEQLMDIYRFDREKFDAIADLVELRTETMRPYPLWTLPEEQLKLHPYIGSYAAHGIVLYRENTPRSEWTVAQLEKMGILKSENARKLSSCLIVEP